MSSDKEIDNKEALGLIKELGELNKKCNLIREKLRKSYPFADCTDWDATGVYTGCSIKGGCLYGSGGELLSKNGGCMREDIPYFVNQYVGYCEDDYHGTMFIKVDDENTFVAIQFWC